MKPESLEFSALVTHRLKPMILEHRARCNYCGRPVTENGMIATPSVGFRQTLTIVTCSRSCKDLFVVDPASETSLTNARKKIQARG